MWDGIVDGGPAYEEIALGRLAPDEVRALSVEYLDGKGEVKVALTMKRQ